MVRDCKQPLNQEQIDIRRKAMFPEGRRNKRDRRNQGGKNGGKRGGGRKERGDGKRGDGDPKRKPPLQGEEHSRKIGGETLLWCGKCGRWGNHKTSEHKTKQQLQQAKEELAASRETQRSVAATAAGNVVAVGATALNF